MKSGGIGRDAGVDYETILARQFIEEME